MLIKPCRRRLFSRAFGKRGLPGVDECQTRRFSEPLPHRTNKVDFTQFVVVHSFGITVPAAPIRVRQGRFLGLNHIEKNIYLFTALRMIQQQIIPKKNLSSSEVKNLAVGNKSLASGLPADGVTDLLCFSHLRWDFVYQRPQHLLSRASRQWRVWFWEEPVWDKESWLEIRPITSQIHRIIPHIQAHTSEEDTMAQQRHWLDQLLVVHKMTDYITWYYTPMALSFTDQLKARLTVYDCMDELSAFHGAPPQLRARERQLVERANLMFTGGYSLFEAKKGLHPALTAFPSSIDYPHFAQARKRIADPADQQAIPTPRIGYSGVIDERFDRDLIRELAANRPDWQFILLGPVVKIDPASLPKGPNIHYLGMKSYQELPAYFSNWQVAMLPFALNESTRFISPTKTPEYLAAGLPVVSTPIRDVVTTYEPYDPVWIADTASTFEQAISQVLTNRNTLDWSGIDTFLGQHSWEKTWKAMQQLIEERLPLRARKSVPL